MKQRRYALLSALIAAVALACSSGDAPPGPESPPPEPRSAEELATLDATSWVKIYDPERAWNGYTIAFYRRRLPMLLDMNGNIVHVWPETRVKTRARLQPDGSLLALSLERNVVEYDWDGKLTWEWRPEGFPHHDVIRLANGNILTPVSPRGESIDDLVEVNRDGQEVWRWHSSEHLGEWLRPSGMASATHTNSVHELPPNALFDAGHETFRPGNILVSARNLDLVYIIDRETDKVVWHYSEGLDLQHEAIMIPPGYPGHPNIQIFNNGYRSRDRYRRSRVIELDPVTQEVVWDYESEDFFSPTSALQQPLPNGNVLITSSRGGRSFEMTRDGVKVWEWVPPYNPLRPRRYSYDHAPQLAALGRPDEEAVRPPLGYRHVDLGVYRFSRKRKRRKITLGGDTRQVLRDNDFCTRMLLPSEARAEVEYGLNARHIAAAELDSWAARFSLEITPEATGKTIVVHESTLEHGEIETTKIKAQSVGLEAWDLDWVDLCVKTENLTTPGAPTEEFAWWSSVSVRPGQTPALWESETAIGDDLTPEEREAQIKHLKALGYVD